MENYYGSAEQFEAEMNAYYDEKERMEEEYERGEAYERDMFEQQVEDDISAW